MGGGGGEWAGFWIAERIQQQSQWIFRLLLLIKVTREIWVSRKNWLSPVIQVTWEARTVGCLKKEGSLPPPRNGVRGCIMTNLLWEGQPRRSNSRDDRRPVAENESSSPSQRPSNIARPNCNCTTARALTLGLN